MSKSSNPRSLGTAGLLFLALLSPRLASAAEPNASDANDASASARITELNETGAKAYADRNYRLAIEKFVEAYAIDHDPNLLFNIARCYEKLGDVGAAIEKYEAFIAAPGADTDGRLKAKVSLRELRLLESQGGTNSGQRSEAQLPSENAGVGPATPDGGSSPNLLPWLALGGGALATGVGVTFYLLGMRDHDRVTNAPGFGDGRTVHPMTHAEAQSYVDSGDSKKLVGGLGLGLGGALLATSAVLFLTGGKRAEVEPTAALTLDPRPGGAFAAYRGSF
jgi:hypothetical protein